MGTNIVQKLEITSQAGILSQRIVKNKHFGVQSKTLQDFS